MRASEEMADNPWPPDMTITVQNSSNSLLGLLWLRSAWQLDPLGDSPPPLEEPPPVSGIAPDPRTWEQKWVELWRACVTHEARGPDGNLFEQLQATENGSEQRARLLTRLIGPDWRDDFGEQAFDDSYSVWLRARHEEIRTANVEPLENSPERRSLDALIGAWRAGLSTVITIPCLGEHTRVIGSSALLVTERTRREPARYTAALTAFGERREGR